jgi:Ca2+-binding RTX toxin-like protein
MAVVNDYTALMSGNYWYAGPPAGRAVVLTYSFSATPEQAIAIRGDTSGLGFQPFDEAARVATRQALALWSAVSGVTFLEMTGGEGDLTFGIYNLATLGAGDAAGTGGYPSSGAFIGAGGKLQVYSGELTAGGDIHIDGDYRATTTETDLLHVLLHEIGHTLGLKHPHEDDPTLGIDNGNLTVMSYQLPRNTVLGPYDITAIQAIYGTPTGAQRLETWSWNATTETYTASIPGDGRYLRGTSAKDIVTALGSGVAVVTMQGDDIINIGSGAAEVNAGSGRDVINVAMEFRQDRAMSFGGNASFAYLFNDGSVLQQYHGVEELNFTNGSYDFAGSRFVFTLPAPDAPVFREWWVDGAGTLSIAGTAAPGSEVRFSGVTGAATAAADGSWTMALPAHAGFQTLSAIANRQGQDSATAAFGMRYEGTAEGNNPGVFDAPRGLLSGGGGDDHLFGGAGDDLLLGGAGSDTAHIDALQAQTRVGVAGDTMVLRGPQGMDTLLGMEQVWFSTGGPITVATLSAGAEPLMSRLYGGLPKHFLADPYTGGLAGLAYQFAGDGLAETVTGTSTNDLMEMGGGADTVNGGAGHDRLAGGAGDDTVDGGEGTDTAVFSGNRDQYRIGVAGDEIRVRGPEGSDVLRGIEQLEFADTAAITLATLQGSPETEELMSLLVDGTLRLQLPDTYGGPLNLRYLFTGTNGSDVAAGTSQNDFANLGDGNDAASMNAGDDIVDGGGGNNFLTGGPGRDVYFVDGRFMVPVWSCVTDWEVGEQLAIWGWQEGVSTYTWGENDGLAGFLGATFYGDFDGNGLVETAVTVTGRTVAEMPAATVQVVSGLGLLTFG